MGARSRLSGSVGAAAALALTALGCSAAGPPRPSVVVVLIDQLRKDSSDRHLGRVNALAERGVVFDDMRAVGAVDVSVGDQPALRPVSAAARGRRSRHRQSSLTYFDPERFPCCRSASRRSATRRPRS